MPAANRAAASSSLQTNCRMPTKRLTATNQPTIPLLKSCRCCLSSQVNWTLLWTGVWAAPRAPPQLASADLQLMAACAAPLPTPPQRRHPPPPAGTCCQPRPGSPRRSKMSRPQGPHRWRELQPRPFRWRPPREFWIRPPPYRPLPQLAYRADWKPNPNQRPWFYQHPAKDSPMETVRWCGFNFC